MRFNEFKPLNEFDAAAALSQAGTMYNILHNPFADFDNINNTISSNDKSTTSLPKSSNVKANVDSISNYLKSKMDDNHRLGILANIQGESGFNPGIIGDNNTSGGLFQHHNERFSNMVNFVGNDWQTDWKGQIDFALSEPEGKEYLNKKFNSAEDATEWWVVNFERPKYVSRDTSNRIGMLKNFS